MNKDYWIPAIGEHPSRDKYLLDGIEMKPLEAELYLRRCGFSAIEAVRYLDSLEVQK